MITGKNQDLGDHLEMNVFPSLFNRLDQAFRDFGFIKKGNHWEATDEAVTRTLPGAPRANRVCAYENTPYGFMIHGERFIPWLEFTNGMNFPRGRAYIDKAKVLSEVAGVPFPERELSDEDVRKAEAASRRQSLFETLQGCCHEALVEDTDLARQAREYLINRGFDENRITELRFGVFTTAVKDRLIGAGFSEEEIIASGVIHDPRWEGRLIFPWRDHHGQIGTFIAWDLTGTAENKCLYMTVEKGWAQPKADLMLFGLDTALRCPEGKDDIIVVEGLMDVLLFHEAGFENIAAIGAAGGQLKAEILLKLASWGVKSVTLAMDFDPKDKPCPIHNETFCYPCSPGVQGTLKALENAQKANGAPDIYVVDPKDLWEAAGKPSENDNPSKVDPDSLIREKGLDAFKAVLDKRIPGHVYYGSILLEGITPENPEHERREAVGQIFDYAASIRSLNAALDEEDLLTLAADRTGYTFEALQECAEAHEKEKQQQEKKQDLHKTLRKAQTDLQGEADPGKVAQGLISCLSAQASPEDPPPPFSVDRLVKESMELSQGKPFGLKAMDEDLDISLNATELVIIAGRTGHVKTTILVSIAFNQMLKASDEIFVFYSMEEPEIRIFHRLLSRFTCDECDRWTANNVRDYLGDPDRDSSNIKYPKTDSLKKAEENLRSVENSLMIVNKPSWNVDQIVAHAHHLNETMLIGGIFIDYLQRVNPPEGRFDRRDIEVSAISRRFKEMAKDLSVPVIVGAQINREAVSEARKIPDKDYEDESVQKALRKRRPQLHQLREGGSEQEADIVIGLQNYRADYEEDIEKEERSTVPPVTRLDIGMLKTRYGIPGRWVALAFDGRFGLIRDPEPGEF